MSNGAAIVLAALLLPAAPASAGATEAAAALRAITGQTIVGLYAGGTSFREAFHADGTTLYTDEKGTSEGRVSAIDDRICFSYPGTNDLYGGCFTVNRRGGNCFDFYAVASVATPGERASGAAWDARAWREGEADTCTDVPVG